MPARFRVVLTPSFQRDLEALSAPVQRRILAALGALETNPFGPPARIKKLRGRGTGQWRLIVWPYRVRYDIVDQDVVLYRVRHRSEIYRD